MITISHALRCFVTPLLVVFVLDLLSCDNADDNDSDNDAPIGRATQALTDTDSDGMDDTWETTYFGNLSATSAADADADGMTNGEEYLYDFVPNVNDAFADADGDRYPNVFEVRKGSDPNNQSSIPTPTYVVNGAGGGTPPPMWRTAHTRSSPLHRGCTREQQTPAASRSLHRSQNYCSSVWKVLERPSLTAEAPTVDGFSKTPPWSRP